MCVNYYSVFNRQQRVTIEPDPEYWPVEISDTAREVYFRDYQHFQRFLKRYGPTYGKHFQRCVVRFTVKEKAETITDIYVSKPLPRKAVNFNKKIA